jgi:hypothetical protein
MKKLTILSISAMLCAATVGYSQTTTNSTGKGKANTGSQQVGQGSSIVSDTTSSEKAAGGENAVSSPTAATTPTGKAVKPTRHTKTDAPKSILNTQEATKKRRENLTERDTTVKKGSGSAPKNMKNNTGKTNNYNNQSTKANKDGQH